MLCFINIITKYICDDDNTDQTHTFNVHFTRYFFCPGFRQSLAEFYNQCFLCNSVKKSVTPKPPYREPNPPEHPGISFNIDVMKRAKQIILVCTDTFSKYTTATIIPSESAEDQAIGIISLVTPVRRSNKIDVKVDVFLPSAAVITIEYKKKIEILERKLKFYVWDKTLLPRILSVVTRDFLNANEIDWKSENQLQSTKSCRTSKGALYAR